MAAFFGDAAFLVNREGFLAEVFHPWVRWEGPGSGFESLSVAAVAVLCKSGIGLEKHCFGTSITRGEIPAFQTPAAMTTDKLSNPDPGPSQHTQG